MIWGYPYFWKHPYIYFDMERYGASENLKNHEAKEVGESAKYEDNVQSMTHPWDWYSYLHLP